MAVSYKKLLKLLIDLDMKKKDLQQVSGVGSVLIDNCNFKKTLYNYMEIRGYFIVRIA